MALKSDAQDQPDLAETLYTKCLDLFTIVSKEPELSKFSQNDVEKLREQVAKLYLWGEGFQDGKLNLILKSSPSLRVTIVKFLVELAKALLNRKAPRTSYRIRTD